MARFRSPLRRKASAKRSGIGSWWMIWRMPVLLLIVMAVWWFAIRPNTAQPEWVEVPHSFAICGAGEERQAGCVVDGDTVVIGFGTAQRRIRLTGFDAPELDGACEAERSAAAKARGRLRAWLGEGPFEWDGGVAPPRDQYGRELREARRMAANGEVTSLAETMIEAGLASESGWGATPRDWCRQPGG